MQCWIVCLLALAVIFLVFGIVLVVFSAKVKDHLVRYDTKCTAPNLPVLGSAFSPSMCYVSLSIPETMEGPVFFTTNLTISIKITADM